MNQENTLFYNGKISTMDEKNTVADSIYVEKGIIKYVGKLSDVENGAKTGSNKIDLGGKRVLPGLIDTHTHFTRAALSEIRTQQFVPDTIKDVLDYVKEKTSQVVNHIFCPDACPAANHCRVRFHG